MNLVALPDYDIRPATESDAGEILVLQRACWVQEAIINDTLALPALHETLDEVVGWIRDWDVWVLRRGGRLVGAVRGRMIGATDWEIGRLMVAPDHSHLGLGRWLLGFVEEMAPHSATRAILFTGQRSERNIRLYQHAGYHMDDVPPEIAHEMPRGAVLLAKPLRHQPRPA